ncbi:50S ribosomal protein L15 [Candidatus Synechococcus spongiarum]|uniref:Large ribosomal subunit protein uL15 n=1 Tax=Candidatus Synechococcus spongiarum TaxID=431041 RepID=A0A164ZQ17_9SYNE|nr:50S ribosomal protein L15 [Candidatus Synechococcus spongiarum]SAY38409.1 LSU ribosomal protein L15p (L27Ae) [Candidatus Synechococcus spongiarum]
MTVHLHTLQPQPGSRRPRNRKGRGIAAGQGASCGFGMRGQKSRSGRPTRPGFEGGQMPLYRRIPKLKHFTVVNPKLFTVVNVGDLSALPDGSEVTLASLRAAGIVGKNSAPLKVLGDGDLKVRLHCKAHGFSKTAREKILAAGGACDVLPGRSKWARPGKISGDQP